MFAFSFNFFFCWLSFDWHLTPLPSLCTFLGFICLFPANFKVTGPFVPLCLGLSMVSPSLFLPPSSCRVLPLSPLSGFVCGSPLCPSPSLVPPPPWYSSLLPSFCTCYSPLTPPWFCSWCPQFSSSRFCLQCLPSFLLLACEQSFQYNQFSVTGKCDTVSHFLMLCCSGNQTSLDRFTLHVQDTLSKPCYHGNINLQ